VTVEISRVENPGHVELPEELIAALELEDGLRERFEKLGTGIRRSMAYWVNSGKRPETRAQRAVEILRRLQSGRLVSGGKPVKF